jgi:Na+-transporting NADH:ubiquinone oxidoreductase subunit C
LLFAAALCAACSLVVSSVAVSLRDRQEVNRRLLGTGRQLLSVAGLVAVGEKLSAADVAQRLSAELEPRIVDLRTGVYAIDVDPLTYDQRRAARDPASSRPAPENQAQVARVPKYAKIFLRRAGDEVDAIVLPVEGMGLWAKMYGYVALERDARTVRGIAFYEHAETPGLGAEIENPEWRAQWRGRLAFDERGKPRIAVKKGKAGPVTEDPYHVDGISGSTLTGDGVTHLLRFWLGDHGFGPFLERYRQQRGRG